MGLTIKMRIDEQPEHTYVFTTGDGGQIELIPLSVVQNGSYTAPDGKAYNIVTVNVPETELEHLNITENGTYTAEDGKAYDVVTVNIQPILESVSRSFTANGTYTIVPSEGFDGISGVTINIDVPTGGGGDVVAVYKRFSPFTPSDDDKVYTIDLSEDSPQGKSLIGFIIRPALGTFQSIAQGGGRGAVIYYTATRDIDDNTQKMWFKTWLYKQATSSSMASLGNGGVRATMNITPQASPLSNVVGYDNTNKEIKIYCRALDASTTSAFGFALYCPYELYAFYK